MEKVTILVPTYRQPGYVGKSVASALGQDYANLEVVVCIDGPDAETRGALERFRGSPRLRVVEHSENVGRVANYRRGLYTCASGEYVLNLDGDDWFVDSSYISCAARVLRNSPEVGFVFANQLIYTSATGRYGVSLAQNSVLPERVAGGELLHAYAHANVAIPHATALYRRRSAVESGFYSHGILGTDTLSFLRMATRWDVHYLRRYPVVWRVHGANASGTDSVDEHLRNLVIPDLVAARMRLERTFSHEEIESWRQAVLRTRLRGLLIRAFKSGDLLALWKVAAVVGKQYALELPGFSVDTIRRVGSCSFGDDVLIHDPSLPRLLQRIESGQLTDPARHVVRGSLVEVDGRGEPEDC